MTLTTSGTAKNSSREYHVQSLNLAEKGQDYIVNEINTALATFIEKGKSRDDFITELEKYDHTNPKYKCTFNKDGNLIDGLKIITSNNSNDTSLACIKNVYPVSDEKGPNDLKRKLELVSFGEVGSKQQQLTSFVEIGADYIPEQLKYTLTSNGNIHLNGAVQITGDLRYKGSLTTYNKAHIINGAHYWVESLKPSVKSTSSRSNPRIVVSRDSKFYHIKDSNNASNLYSSVHNLNSNYLTVEKDISKLFDTTVFDKVPTVVTTDSKINSVDIDSKKSSYYYSSSDTNNKIIAKYNSSGWYNYYYSINPGTYNNKSYLFIDCNYWGNNCRYDSLDSTQTFYLEGGNYTFDRLATNAGIHITGNASNPSRVTIKNTLFVNGDLTISGNVELSGSIFVNGKLKINKSNLKTNALIYVNNINNTTESVDIQYSTINSLLYRNEKNEPAKGTLVIFSKGKVKLANNSSWSDHDKPSEIYGYFYSDKELEIYGSGSNMKIHGGVYGNRITLHATRGNAKESSFGTSSEYNEYNGWYFYKNTLQDNNSTVSSNQLINDARCNFPNKNNQKKCYDYHSRLQIQYNEDVVSTYIELNKKEELIYKVDPPKFVERN